MVSTRLWLLFLAGKGRSAYVDCKVLVRLHTPSVEEVGGDEDPEPPVLDDLFESTEVDDAGHGLGACGSLEHVTARG